MDKRIIQLADFISESKKLVVFTGAGISCASGIPDFRSENGLYNSPSGYSYRPEEIISHSFFMHNPSIFYKFYREKMIYRDAKPNLAHLFFADLQKTKDVSVVTQNIDGLHQLAGSKKVYELHGSVLRNYCMDCNRFYSLDDLPKDGIPHCTDKMCNGIIKPDVVLYEESLDQSVIEGALRVISAADCLIIVGTSLTVYPAASFVSYYRGNKMVLINKQATSYDRAANLVINEDIVSVIRNLSEYMQQRGAYEKN